MNDLNIFRNACTEEWYAKTYQEYLDACAKDLEELLAVITDCATSTELTEDGLTADELNAPETSARMHQIVQNKLAAVGLSWDLPISIGGGYAKIGDVCSSALYTSSSESMSTTEINPYDVISSADGSSSLPSLSFGETFDQLKTDYQATVVTAAGFLASTQSSISDRVAAFDNALLSRLSSGASNLSSTTNYVRSLLSKSPSVIDFADSVFKASFPQGTDDPQSNISYGNSDMSQYTGANPLIAADFSSIKSAATTVAKTGAKIVAGVFEAALSLGKRLFSKAKQLITDVVVDPELLSELEGGGELGLLDGFQYNYEGTVFFNCARAVEFLDQPELTKYNSNWVKFQTFFGELLMKLSDVQAKRKNNLWGFEATGQWVFKPSLINPELIPLALPTVTSGTVIRGDNSLVSSWLAILSKIRNSDKPFGDLTMTNDQTVASYGSSAAIANQLFRDACYELLSKVFGLSTVQDVYGSGYLGNPADFNTVPVGAIEANNQNLIVVGSGYDPVLENFGTAIPRNNWDMSSDNCLFASAAAMLIVQAFDRSNYPTDWTFLPYSNNITNFEEPRYRVKTDSALQNVVSTFITAAIVVVVVAVVAVGALTAVKKISRDRYFKSAHKAGTLDNKMWQGETLTKKERKQYIRAQKRMAKSSALDFSSSSSNEANVGDYGLETANSFDTVLRTITGQV